MASQKRGFFGRLLVFTLSLLSVIGLVCIVLSVINPYISPKRFIWTSFFGLAFWEIFFFNVLVGLSLLFLWSKRVWIALLSLAIAIPGLNKSFSFGKSLEATGMIRVMSYNVHNFNRLDGETSAEDFACEIMDMVKKENPDVLCCQEFSAFKPKMPRSRCIEIFAENTHFQYIYYNRKHNYGGNVIFSKYPISKVPIDKGLGKEVTSGVLVSVDAGEKGIFHVANTHLMSYQITDKEINMLVNSTENPNNLDVIGMTVAKKLKMAFEKRSDEVDQVMETMPLLDGPIIICGDFNDTPMSYTYRQMQKFGFVDTFTKVGRGIKPTYAGKLPLMRIDYIWANDKVEPLNFTRLRHKASDHYPIILDFAINK